MNLKEVLLLITCASILALNGCQGEAERKAKYYEKGKTYLEQRNFSKARVELKNALQIDPKYADAYFLMGKVEEADKNWRKTFGYYKKASDLDPDNIAARGKLGRFYILSNQLDKAKEQQDIILAKKSDDHEGLLLQAAILDRENNYTKAIQVTEKVIADDPTNIEAIAFTANIHIRQKNINKAIKTLTRGLTDNKQDIRLKIMLAQVYVTTEANNKAETLLKEIVSIKPDILLYQVNLSTFYSRSGKLDEAEKILREAIKNNSDDERRYLLLAEFLAQKRGVKQAEKELISAIENKPDIYKLRFALARLYKKNNEHEKAINVYRKIIAKDKYDPSGLEARNELALLLANQRKITEAGQLVEEVLKENPGDNNALIIKGKLALFAKDAQTAINSFRLVLKDQPTSIEVTNLLSEAYLLNNETELSKQILQRLASENPTIETKLNLAKYYARNKNYDRAEVLADDILNLAINNLDALKLKSLLLKVKRDQKGLKAMLIKTRQSHPNDPWSYRQLGNIHAAKKEYKAARQEYKAALKKSDKLLPNLALVIKTYLSQKQYDKAIEFLNSTLSDADKNNASVYELMGEVYITKKDFLDAEKSFRKAIAISPKWSLPYSSLAKMYRSQNKKSEQMKVYQEGLQANSDSENLLAELAAYHERDNEYDKAISTYEKMLSINSDNKLAANNLASLLTDKKGDEASLKRAESLAARFKNTAQPAFLDTLGWVYYKQEKLDDAALLLSKAVEMAPGIPHFQYHLGMTYYKQGKSEAKTHLTKAIKSELNFPGKEEAEETLKKLQ